MSTNRRQVAHHEESCESGVKQEGDPFGGRGWNTQAAYAARVGCKRITNNPTTINACWNSCTNTISRQFSF